MVQKVKKKQGPTKCSKSDTCEANIDFVVIENNFNVLLLQWPSCM